MRNLIKKIANLISEKLGIAEIKRMVAMDRRMSIANYLNSHLYSNPKYKDSNRLNKYEFSIRSQDGGDGIISEIFRRIGTTNKKFVEFGVGDGLQNNTVYLLMKGWSGVWFEGDSDRENNTKIQKNLKMYIKSKQLNVFPAFITAENVENMFTINNVPKELDLLSIDIDGNDYWVWNAIKSFKPRVFVVEYNASYGSDLSVAPLYSSTYIWKRTNFYGSSISAFDALAKKKGYLLVACSFLGNNAFFVREDLVKDKFDLNLTKNDLFEDHKAFLLQNRKYSDEFVSVVKV
jgi:hypothetical protein